MIYFASLTDLMTTMCSARLSADECAAKMRVENWAAGSCVEKKLSI